MLTKNNNNIKNVLLIYLETNYKYILQKCKIREEYIIFL